VTARKPTEFRQVVKFARCSAWATKDLRDASNHDRAELETGDVEE